MHTVRVSVVFRYNQRGKGMSVGSWELGKVCVLLNENATKREPELEDKINGLAAEAADRISTTPAAKAKLHGLFVWYMNKAVEAAKD